MSEREITQINIADLKPHPRQAHLFPVPSDHQLNELAQDLEKHGLRIPIEILPDGTIVCGHCRVDAARQLGWTTIDAVVLHDLATQGDDAVESYMIRDNAVRRQLSPLQRARCAKRLREMMARDSSGDVPQWRRQSLYGQTRNAVGEMLGISGREVSRLLRVLETPIEVQNAYDNGQLSLHLAGKVAGLPRDIQQEIAEGIAFGENAKQVVQEYVTENSPPTARASDAYRRFLKHVESAVTSLPGRVDEVRIYPSSARAHAEILQSGRDLVQSLLDHVEAQCERDTVSHIDPFGDNSHE